MTINWPLISVLFCLAAPGVFIAVKRLIYFLLTDNSDALKKRLSNFAISQTLLMVLVMSFAGAVLSPKTGLRAPVLEGLLSNTIGISAFFSILLPSIFYALLGLFVFLGLYYGVIRRFVDPQSWQTMTKMRAILGIDGCALYGGVVEEVIARWGLMNLTAFFALIITQQIDNLVICCSIVISGLIFALGQLPAYLAAGCLANRRFIYSFIVLSLSQSLLFGYLFWQYGIICSILSHVLFHLGWALYEFKITR